MTRANGYMILLLTYFQSASKKGTVDDDSFIYDARGYVNGAVFGSSRTPHDDSGQGEDPDGEGRQKEYLRVTYEDPKQTEEKKRLRTLLGGVPADKDELPPVKNAGLTRRSARIAGF
jgi:hypothetical protein